MRFLRTFVPTATLGFGLLLAAGCASTETFNVTVSYVLEPTEGLPEGLSTVAILDAGVETKFGDSEDKDRSVKWAKIAADTMESMISDSAKKFDSGLTVAKRRETTKVMAEKDLKLAGLVDGAEAAQAAKMLDVQALISTQLNIRVEVKKSKKTTIDITSIAGYGGHHWGGGSGTFAAREADQIARNMTLQCKFSMLDAATGQALLEYAPKPFRRHDSKKPGVLFGRSSGEADLDSVDMYIGNLVERGTREFVSMFVPCEVEYSYELKSSGNKASASGVRALRMDNYESAMQFFKSALAEDPEDHRSAFCLGVTCELNKDWEGALKYYRQTAGMPGLDDDEMAMYLAAKNRVGEHKDRIRKESK